MLLEIKAFREGKSMFLQDIRVLLNTVQAKGPLPFAVFKGADYMLEFAVSDELVRTESERFPFVIHG